MGKPKIDLADFDEMLNFELESPSSFSGDSHAPAPQNSGIGGMTEMDFDQMESFPNHKFKLYEGQRLTDMVESIRQFGILLPLILWHTEDGRYIILSGHNCQNAAQLAGLTGGPVIIREKLTHDEAVLIVTETNLCQRSFADMSHSERAYCLAEHYQAMKCQGRRTDILEEIERLLNPHGCEVSETSDEDQHRLKSRVRFSRCMVAA